MCVCARANVGETGMKQNKQKKFAQRVVVRMMHTDWSGSGPLRGTTVLHEMTEAHKDDRRQGRLMVDVLFAFREIQKFYDGSNPGRWRDN